MSFATLQKGALLAWRAWGSEWAMYAECSCCGEMKHCRGKRRSKLLCLECFDLS